MKLHADIHIGNKLHKKGSNVPLGFIYPFFLVHMLAFGSSGFFLAYSADSPDVSFLFMHGGIAITVYIIFYLAIFGRDEVKWMFINAGLGALGILSQINWALSLFDKQVDQFPWYVHVVPFLYLVLYTFLLRQLLLDLFRARENKQRQRRVETGYVVIAVAICLLTLQL